MTTVDVYISKADGSASFSLHNGLFGAATTALHALISKFQGGTISGPWHSSYIDTTVTGTIVRAILAGISELDPPYHQPGDWARFAAFQEAFLLEALHPECEDALRDDDEMVVEGEPLNPRLHITLHQVVANQLLADNPPQTWQTVQRLAGLGYDWHNIMHMIARLVSDDIYRATTEQKPFGLRDYVQQLSELPGDWPAPPAAPS